MTRSVWLLVALLASGCSSWKLSSVEKPPVAPNVAERGGGLARVCVIRDSHLAQAVTFPVYDNGKLVGATRGPSYFCYLAEPGDHEIKIEADQADIAKLSAAPGRAYYLSQEVDNLFGFVKARAVWLERDAALEALGALEYQVLIGVPGDQELPGGAPCAPARPTSASVPMTKAPDGRVLPPPPPRGARAYHGPPVCGS
jgi:hypothetical protein